MFNFGKRRNFTVTHASGIAGNRGKHDDIPGRSEVEIHGVRFYVEDTDDGIVIVAMNRDGATPIHVLPMAMNTIGILIPKPSTPKE